MPNTVMEKKWGGGGKQQQKLHVKYSNISSFENSCLQGLVWGLIEEGQSGGW